MDEKKRTKSLTDRGFTVEAVGIAALPMVFPSFRD